MMSAAFGEPVGQGWTQIGELAVAFVLSLLIGLERETKQKAAGMRTYTLVGLGAALFVLISKYGFTDVLGAHVTLDPSRVAAQIVTGVGFIGGGLIFVRRDAVRGLTTAASVWLTAAVGAAAGAGLVVLAAVSTGMYFVVLYGLRPLARLVARIRPEALRLRVRYLDGRGVLRDVLNVITGRGYLVAELTTLRTGEDGSPESPERDDRRGHEIAGSEAHRPSVEVTVTLSGRGDLAELTAALADMDGVLGVRAGPAETD